MSAPTRRLRCPDCYDWTRLSLFETHDEHGTTDYGEVFISETGALIPPGPFFFEVGGTTLVMAKCGTCGHEWKPRRQSIEPESTDSESGH